jgi:hypothetical protein
MAYLIDINIIIYSLKKDKNVQAKFIEHERIPKSISIIELFGNFSFRTTSAKKTRFCKALA